MAIRFLAYLQGIETSLHLPYIDNSLKFLAYLQGIASYFFLLEAKVLQLSCLPESQETHFALVQFKN